MIPRNRRAMARRPTTSMDKSNRIRRDVVDGVPVFWAPDARQRASVLQFRVGQSDETPPTAGISHVVEHLALFGLGRRAYPSNGGIDHIRTLFYAQGSDAEVLGFVTDVAKSLSSLPLERLDAELRVLRTEAAHRGTPWMARHLSLRYGPRGFGLSELQEYGLHTLTATAVSDWAATRYTRGNVVAVIAGPPPDGLRFELPEGARRPIVPREPLSGVPDRSWYRLGNAPGIALGMVVGRTSAGAASMRILTRVLEQRLRRDLAHSYEVRLAYIPLDASEAIASLFASCLPEDAVKVRAEMLQVVESFASEGPTQDDIDWDVADFARFVDDDASLLPMLDGAAHDELVGHPRRDAAELLEELRALRRDEARDAFAGAAARATLIDGIDHAPLTGGWEAYPVSSSRALAGRRLDPVSRRFWQKRLEQLIVGDEGVSWVNLTDGTILSVPYAQCVALVVEGSALTLVAEDLTRINVEAAYWTHGDAVVREIEAAVPASRVVRIAQPDASPP